MSHALSIKICLWIAFTEGGEIYIFFFLLFGALSLDRKVSLDDSMASLLRLNDY